MIFGSLKTSLNISTNQGIRVYHPKGGYFLTHVIENTEHFLVLLIPKKRGFNFQQDDKVDVYFWRENDRGYEFSTAIIGIVNNPVGLLLLKHVDEMKQFKSPVCITEKVLLPMNFFLIPSLLNEKVFNTVNIDHFNASIIKLGDREFSFEILSKDHDKKSLDKIKKNTLIKGVFDLPNHKKKSFVEIDLVARIIKNIYPREQNSSTDSLKASKICYSIDAIFTNITDRSRNHILHYIYSF